MLVDDRLSDREPLVGDLLAFGGEKLFAEEGMGDQGCRVPDILDVIEVGEERTGESSDQSTRSKAGLEREAELHDTGRWVGVESGHEIGHEHVEAHQVFLGYRNWAVGDPLLGEDDQFVIVDFERHLDRTIVVRFVEQKAERFVDGQPQGVDRANRKPFAAGDRTRPDAHKSNKPHCRRNRQTDHIGFGRFGRR